MTTENNYDKTMQFAVHIIIGFMSRIRFFAGKESFKDFNF